MEGADGENSYAKKLRSERKRKLTTKNVNHGYVYLPLCIMKVEDGSMLSCNLTTPFVWVDFILFFADIIFTVFYLFFLLTNIM